MRKLFLFGFAAAAAMGFGCAITNYSLITDVDQGGVVNTRGKAYIRQSSQTATAWPDGNDNLVWYVDQRWNGNRTLRTYNYETALDQDPFKDDLYCSPDWEGCAIVTADDPERCDVDEFDYRANTHCSGYRSLSLLVSTSRYYGECGRATATDRTMKMISLANDMKPVLMNGTTWLRANLTALNTSIVLNNRAGSVYALPMTSQVGVSANFGMRRLILDLSNPNTRTVAENALAWNTAHPGPAGVDATLTVNGVDLTYRVKPTANAATWTQVHY